MNVITERPIYSYTDGDASTKNTSTKKTAKQKREAAAEKVKTTIENPFVKTLLGATGGYVKDWSERTGSMGTYNPIGDQGPVDQIMRDAQIQTELDEKRKEQERKDKQRRLYRNIGIGVGVAAIVGLGLYFAFRGRKGSKSAKK